MDSHEWAEGLTYEELVSKIRQHADKHEVARIRFEYLAKVMAVDPMTRKVNPVGVTIPNHPGVNGYVGIKQAEVSRTFIVAIPKFTGADELFQMIDDARKVIRRELGDLLPHDISHFRFFVEEYTRG